jgi:hypothetical protein
VLSNSRTINRSVGSMELRHDPLLSYRGLCSWPPVWVRSGGEKNKSSKGEIGILKDIWSDDHRRNRCFLIIEDKGTEYMGCLLISDRSFCRQVYNLLLDHCGQSIQYIGGLEMRHTL